MLWRCRRALRDLSAVTDNTRAIAQGDILLFATIRNEAARLPGFLAHYRRLGVAHFLIVDNGSDDGGETLLTRQPDVSLWQTRASYREARFGMEWLGGLMGRYAHGHWCVTVDADELLIYPDHDRRDLRAVASHLDARGIAAMGALMLDLYPRAELGAPVIGDDLTAQLPWFDAGPWRSRVIQPRRNRQVQGGARERVFYADDPARSPTLNKLPFVRWRRGYVWFNSTHSMLPARLNDLYDGPGDPRLSGVLLHGKFQPQIVAKSHEELLRRQHFVDPDASVDYHRALMAGPTLWHAGSVRYDGWRQLVDLGLMASGDWMQ